MRIVCISDTHLRHGFDMPDGDVLVHAGDATMTGTDLEVRRFASWFSSFPHPFRVFVAGNHDWMFQRQPDLARRIMKACGIIYLEDSAVDVGGVKFYGSPWQPEFFDWAFNLPRGEALAEKWAKIPDDTNVLITHGPPFGILDVVKRPDGHPDRMDYGTTPKERHLEAHVGCKDLAERIGNLGRLKLHVFGHIHVPGMERRLETEYVNATICNEKYRAAYEPAVVDLSPHPESVSG